MKIRNVKDLPKVFRAPPMQSEEEALAYYQREKRSVGHYCTLRKSPANPQTEFFCERLYDDTEIPVNLPQSDVDLEKEINDFLFVRKL